MGPFNSGAVSVSGTSRTNSMASTTNKSGISFKGFLSGNSSKTGNGGKSVRSITGGSSSRGSCSNSNKYNNSIGNNTANTTSHNNTKTKRTIGVGRIVLVIVLLGSAAGLGFAAYTMMENAESRLAKDRFNSIAKRAEANAEWVLQEKKQATDALAKMMGSVNPNASAWPFVYMEGYQDIASSLRLITKGSMSFCPIVKGYIGGNESESESEQQKFQDFYYNLYENKWGYPNGTGESSFGKGIFAYGYYDVVNQKTWPDYRYPILSNYSAHGIPNPDNIVVPFVQSDFGVHSALMLDVNFEVNRAKTIHNIIKCSERRKQLAHELLLQDPGNTTEMMDCGSITDMLWQPTKAEDVQAGPTGIIFSPIYPLLDNTTLTGFILHKQVWHDLLKHAFESDVSGIRVVLHTDSGAEHSYSVENGEVDWVGNRTHYCIKHASGDQEECNVDDEWVPFDDLKYLLDETNDEYRHLNKSISDGIYCNETVEYFMDIYATEEFVSQFGRVMGGQFDPLDIYSHENFSHIPISVAACIATVLVMVFTSLVFFTYDHCVRKEFDSKERLLEAKRRFVRYVSHEVRTPLNTVCMGLTLLQNDLSSALVSSSNNNITNTSSTTNKGTANEKANAGRSNQKVNHQESPLVSTTNNNNNNNNTSDDVVVLKREYLEEWMNLSTQVFQNADAAVGVLSDLLNYDKIQMGTLTLELSLFNLWSALEKTVEEFQMTATEKHVSLKLDFFPLLMTSSSLQLDNNNNIINTKNSSKEGSIQPVEESLLETAMAATKTLKASDLPAIIRNCKVVGDKIRLVQVFRNLLSNGLKFSKKYTNITVRVVLDPLPERKQKLEKISLHKDILAEVTNIGSVSIEVIDEGVGMTKEQVATVFDDGTQFDANTLQAGGGSGLGLNIARGIILEHGDSLTCSSEGLGKGSTFTLTTSLYYSDLPSSSRPSKLSALHRNPSISNGGGIPEDMIPDAENAIESSDFVMPSLRVLVVDDSVTNRKLCRRLLERNGHTTEGACDGKEAVDMVKESLQSGQFYDCILLDYEMPVMNGPDACQLIRKMGCSSYIAGVTGNVMSEDVDHFRNCGANWVLPKPFKLKSLEDQWVEDGVTAFTQTYSVIRVESSPTLIEMGDGIKFTFDSEIKPESSQ